VLPVQDRPRSGLGDGQDPQPSLLSWYPTAALLCAQALRYSCYRPPLQRPSRVWRKLTTSSETTGPPHATTRASPHGCDMGRRCRSTTSGVPPKRHPVLLQMTDDLMPHRSSGQSTGPESHRSHQAASSLLLPARVTSKIGGTVRPTLRISSRTSWRTTAAPLIPRRCASAWSMATPSDVS